MILSEPEMLEQADGTYAHNIEHLSHRVCMLAKEGGEEDAARRLRATSLQCLSAMVIFILLIIFKNCGILFFFASNRIQHR